MLFIHVFVVLLSSFFKLEDTSKLVHCLTIQPFMSKTYQELTIQSQMTLKTIIHLQMFSPSYGYYFICNR